MELSYRRLNAGVVDIPVDDDLGGVDQPEGELLFHDEEGLPGLGAFGEGVDAVYAGVDLEIENGGGDHGSADDDDAEHRVPGDDAGDKLPEPPSRGLRDSDSCPAEEGNG